MCENGKICMFHLDRTLCLDGDRLAKSLLEVLVIRIDAETHLKVVDRLVEVAPLEIEARATQERLRVRGVSFQALAELDDLIEH